MMVVHSASENNLRFFFAPICSEVLQSSKGMGVFTLSVGKWQGNLVLKDLFIYVMHKQNRPYIHVYMNQVKST